MNLGMFVIDGKNKFIIVIILLFFIKFIIDFNVCIFIMFFQMEGKGFVYYLSEEGNVFDEFCI